MFQGQKGSWKNTLGDSGWFYVYILNMINMYIIQFVFQPPGRLLLYSSFYYRPVSHSLLKPPTLSLLGYGQKKTQGDLRQRRRFEGTSMPTSISSRFSGWILVCQGGFELGNMMEIEQDSFWTIKVLLLKFQKEIFKKTKNENTQIGAFDWTFVPMTVLCVTADSILWIHFGWWDPTSIYRCSQDTSEVDWWKKVARIGLLLLCVLRNKFEQDYTYRKEVLVIVTRSRETDEMSLLRRFKHHS